MKIITKLSDVTVWFVYLVILLVVIIAAPMVAGYRPMVVLTGSMEPTYPVGSMIYYKYQDYESIEVRDVITFEVGDQEGYVTHRVVAKDDTTQSVVTKGDANATNDVSPVSGDRIVGVVAKTCIPYAGFFVDIVKEVSVIVVLGCIIAINMILHGMVKRNDVIEDKEGEGSIERVEKK